MSITTGLFFGVGATRWMMAERHVQTAAEQQTPPRRKPIGKRQASGMPRSVPEYLKATMRILGRPERHRARWVRETLTDRSRSDRNCSLATNHCATDRLRVPRKDPLELQKAPAVKTSVRPLPRRLLSRRVDSAAMLPIKPGKLGALCFPPLFPSLHSLLRLPTLL